MGVPFECDLCSFRNVVGQDPDETDARDEFTLTAIRRVLLDVMWAREPDTVASNWSRSRRDFDMAVTNLSLNYHTLLPVLGNPRVGDRVGMGVPHNDGACLFKARKERRLRSVRHHTKDPDLVC
jgi:hypothetical protein